MFLCHRSVTFLLAYRERAVILRLHVFKLWFYSVRGAQNYDFTESLNQRQQSSSVNDCEQFVDVIGLP